MAGESECLRIVYHDEYKDYMMDYVKVLLCRVG